MASDAMSTWVTAFLGDRVGLAGRLLDGSPLHQPLGRHCFDDDPPSLQASSNSSTGITGTTMKQREIQKYTPKELEKHLEEFRTLRAMAKRSGGWGAP